MKPLNFGKLYVSNVTKYLIQIYNNYLQSFNMFLAKNQPQHFQYCY